MENPYLKETLTLLNLENIPIAVETGTHHGAGAFEMSKFFKEVYTIELCPKLCELCRERFKDTNVTVVEGSSIDKLQGVILGIKDKFICSLDGHGSGGDTVYDESVGRYGAPVLEELEILKQNPPEIIIVDDLDDFYNIPSYPHPDKIFSKVKEIGEYTHWIREGGSRQLIFVKA